MLASSKIPELSPQLYTTILIADILSATAPTCRDGKASASGSQETCHGSAKVQSFRVKGNEVDGLPFYFNYFLPGAHSV